MTHFIYFRYPYLATEIICCDVDEILDAILQDKSYLDQLWTILDRPAPLSPGHANSFAKIMAMIITTYTVQVYKLVFKESL